MSRTMKKTGLLLLIMIIMINSFSGCALVRGRGYKAQVADREMKEKELIIGITTKEIGLVKEGIEHGADMNIFSTPVKWGKTEYDTPLYLAFCADNQAAFDYLVSIGADVSMFTNAISNIEPSSYVIPEAYLDMFLEAGIEPSDDDVNRILRDPGSFDSNLWRWAEKLIAYGASYTEGSVRATLNNDYGNENLPKVVKKLRADGIDTGLDEITESIILADSKRVRELLPKDKKKEEKLRQQGALIAAYCDSETLEMALSNGKINDMNERTLLRSACRAGNMENVKYLVTQLEIENEENDWSDIGAIQQAESNRHYEVVNYLVEQGFDMPTNRILYSEVECGWGNVLTIDVMNQDRERLDYWLEHKEYLNDDDLNAALGTAIGGNHVEDFKYIYEYIKENGYQLQEADILSAIFTSMRTNHEILEYVLEQGITMEGDNNKELITAITYADAKAVEMMLEAGADPNEDPSTWSYVIATDDIDKIRSLVEHGMDINAGEDVDYRMISLAAYVSNGVLSYLLEQGADISVGSGGEDALLNAVTTGRVQNAKTLIDAGIDLTVKDEDGKTAYDIAVENEDEEMIALLESAQAQ